MQCWLAKAPDSVRGLTQLRLMPRSDNVGQHVTVVTDAAPVVSWHAVTYPDGQRRPGEKYSPVVKPCGKQDTSWPIKLTPLS